MSSYVFLNLPENYRLADALADGNEHIWWRTTRLNRKITAGDRVFLWQGRGNDPAFRGVHAVAEVVEGPRRLHLHEFDDYWQNEGEKAVSDEHTRLRIVERAPRGGQLLQGLILSSAILREKGVFNGAMGVNFTLTEVEADELYRVWRQHVSVIELNTGAPLPADNEGKFDETARQLLEKKAAGLLGKSLDELEQIISKPGRTRDQTSQLITVAGRPRDPAIVAYARVRAGNRCEVDACSIPLFQTPQGLPFVEVHHIKPLSEGGPDAITNVACVCPSHHREAHHGTNALAIGSQLQALRARA